MKLSIFTTITDPDRRGDNWLSALDCYNDLADEVVVVNGGEELKDRLEAGGHADIVVDSPWPEGFNWPFIGQQFQKGYEAATGDWVIHADLDFIFHEKDFVAIRKAIEDNPTAPALSFYKYQFILPDRFNLKSRLVLAVNKKRYGDRIRFDSGGDLCQPSLDGKEIKPQDVPATEVAFYNYEKITKTKDQIRDDAIRMEDAYRQHFGRDLYSFKGHDAFEGLVTMLVGRFNKPQQIMPLDGHPKYVKQTIASLRPDQWGFNGLGYLIPSNYAKGQYDA